MHSLLHVGLKKFGAGGLAMVAATALMLTGCGGSDGPAAAASVTGQFVDAPVAGLGYKCGTATTLGTTDGNGNYTCKTGESVGFYVGDILLGTVASAQAIVTPLDLVGPGAQPTDTSVSNIVRFLLSISRADTAGNLVIDTATAAAAKGKTIDFKTIASGALDAMITTVKPGTTAVTAAVAENHMRGSIYNLFAKNYSGTYSGTQSGTWNLSISATDGSVSGTYTDSVNGSGSIAGTMSTVMKVSSTYDFTGTAGSATWTGTLNVNTGVFSGTWNSGTFTGKVATATPPVTPGVNTNTNNTSCNGTNLIFTGSATGGPVKTGDGVCFTTATATNLAFTLPTGTVSLSNPIGSTFTDTNSKLAYEVIFDSTKKLQEINVLNTASSNTFVGQFAPDPAISCPAKGGTAIPMGQGMGGSCKMPYATQAACSAAGYFFEPLVDNGLCWTNP